MYEPPIISSSGVAVVSLVDEGEALELSDDNIPLSQKMPPKESAPQAGEKRAAGSSVDPAPVQDDRRKKQKLGPQDPNPPSFEQPEDPEMNPGAEVAAGSSNPFNAEFLQSHGLRKEDFNPKTETDLEAAAVKAAQGLLQAAFVSTNALQTLGAAMRAAGKLKDDRERLQKENTTLRAEVAKLKEENEGLRTGNEPLRVEAESLRGEVADLKEEVDRLAKVNQNYLDDLKRSDLEVETQTGLLDQSNALVERLRGYIASKEVELDLVVDRDVVVSLSECVTVLKDDHGVEIPQEILDKVEKDMADAERALEEFKLFELQPGDLPEASGGDPIADDPGTSGQAGLRDPPTDSLQDPPSDLPDQS